MQWWMWIPIGWFICILAIWAFAFVAHGEPKKPDEGVSDDERDDSGTGGAGTRDEYGVVLRLLAVHPRALPGASAVRRRAGS